MPASEELLLEVLQNAATVPAPVRKAVVTLLLLTTPYEYINVVGYLSKQLRSGKLTGDDQLVRAMYRSLSRQHRIQFLVSFASSAAKPQTFRLIFEDAYFRCQPSRFERGRLAQAFSRYFAVHPRLSAGPLEDLILMLLRSNEAAEKIHGLLVIDKVEKLGEEDLDRVIAATRSRAQGVRDNAWLAVGDLASKPGSLKPPVLAELRKRAEALLRQPNETARSNIQRFLRISERGTSRAVTRGRSPTQSPARRTPRRRA